MQIKSKTMPVNGKNNKGFTLVELMVTLAISTIVLAGIYAAYNAQLKSHVTQQVVVDIQQNLRGSMYYMQRSIRMAGYDPEGVLPNCGSLPTTPIIGFQADFTGFAAPHDISGAATDADSIAFSVDVSGGQFDGVDNDGDGTTDEGDESAFADGTINVTNVNELIAYQLNGTTLEAWVWVGPNPDDYAWQPVAENIESIRFRYFDDSSPPVELVPPLSDQDRCDIRSVEISIEAREVDEIYMRAADKRAQNLTAQVRCRNRL